MQRFLLACLIACPPLSASTQQSSTDQLFDDWRALVTNMRHVDQDLVALSAKLNADAAEMEALEPQIGDLRAKCGKACESEKPAPDAPAAH